jgi:hypothetical protein
MKESTLEIIDRAVMPGVQFSVLTYVTGHRQVCNLFMLSIAGD